MNIPHNRPYIGKQEAQAAYDVILSGQLAAGDKCKAVEAKWANLVQVESACMVSSGLSALRLALRALEIKTNETDVDSHDFFRPPEVIVPAYSCSAIMNSVLSVDAEYVLADIKDDLTLDVVDATNKINSNVNAIIAIHLFGAKADIPYTLDLQKDGEKITGYRPIPIIEDMAHGIFKQTADLAISSFYPTKLIQSCGGGIVSGSKQLVDRVRDLREYGNKEPSLRQNDLPNDVMASMVLVQLDRLEEIQNKRYRAADYYDREIIDWAHDGKIEITSLCHPHPPYRYAIRVPNAKEVAKRMQEKGVIAHNQVVWDYRSQVDWPKDLPGCDKAWDTVLSLPFFPSITVEEQEKVVEVLGECLD